MNGKEILQIEKRVDRGIAWLDKKFGRRNWLKKIHLNKLTLSSPYSCVIGEVMGDYSNLGGFSQSVSRGFDIKGDERAEYNALTAVWTLKLSKLGAKK